MLKRLSFALFPLLLALAAVSGCGDSQAAMCRGTCCRYPSVDVDCNATRSGAPAFAWTCSQAPSNPNAVIGQQCRFYHSPEWDGFCCSG